MASKEFIAKFTGLTAKGTKWTDKHLLMYNAVTVFQDPGEQLVRTGKGIHPSMLI